MRETNSSLESINDPLQNISYTLKLSPIRAFQQLTFIAPHKFLFLHVTAEILPAGGGGTEASPEGLLLGEDRVLAPPLRGRCALGDMREGPNFFFFFKMGKKEAEYLLLHYHQHITLPAHLPFQLSFPPPSYPLPYPPNKSPLRNSPPLIPRVSEPGPGLLLSRWWGPRGGKELRPGRPPRELLHRTPPRGPSRTRWGRGIYFPSLGGELK